ncbi:unnamed protein product, partial [Adineta ricciae]
MQLSIGYVVPNQPKFCPTAIWNRNGSTFANETTLGFKTRSIFINPMNFVYFIHEEKNELLIWDNNSSNPIKRFPGNFSNPASIFVTKDGNIYIDNGDKNGQVQKWIPKINKLTTAMYVYSSCWQLFVDTRDNLYCSLPTHHQVLKNPLYDRETAVSIVAGADSEGSSSDALYDPKGIFVDAKFNLYVADCGNNRVQKFEPGQLDGITVAGDSLSNQTIQLNCPSGIALDSQKYLFIVDSNNHRIIGQGRYGFRCLLGCYGQGTDSTQLSFPSTLSFDRFGNMYVLDQGNKRIQTFQYLENTC